MCFRGKATRRTAYHQSNEDQQCGDGQTERIGRHDRLKSLACREYELNPGNSYTTDSERCQDCRSHGDAEAAQVSGHHIIKHTERICGKDNDKPCITDRDNIRITVEDGQQRMTGDQDKSDRCCGGDEVFQQAEQQNLAAAFQLAGAKILPNEGGAGLAEGIEYVVGYDLNVVGSTGSSDDNGSQTVDGSLDNDIRNRKYRTLNTCGKTDL